PVAHTLSLHDALPICFSGYTKAQLAAFGIDLPDRWASPVWASGHWTGSYFNLPGFLIVFILTLLLVRGVKESAGANNVMVLVKIDRKSTRLNSSHQII